MPQMFPLLWLALMTLVVMIFGLFNILSYFVLQSPEVTKESVEHRVNLKNWQW